MTFEGPGAEGRGELPKDHWKNRPPISPLPYPKGRWERFEEQFLEMLGRHDAPERVAASFAIGVAIAFTPLIGLHIWIALLIAIVLKLNKLDVVLGTLVVNPLTIGPVSAVALPLGRLVVRARHEAVTHLPWAELLRPKAWLQASPAMRTIGLQWGVGMFTLSIVCGALTYIVLVRVIRRRRARTPEIPPDFAD
jgi:uncharacterized protein